jgi:ParB/RepB/Spo0J family partition protein
MPLQLVEIGAQVPLDKIRTSDQKVRRETADQRLDELLNSMQKHGQIHAISLLQDNEDPSTHYELINGLRRFTAASRGQLPHLRANIYQIPAGDEQNKDLLIQQHLYAANMAEPLVPIEKGRMFEALIVEFGWDAERVAACFEGETAETVNESLKFLAIDETVLDVISANPGKFSEGHLRVLAEYSAPSKRAWRIKPDEQLRVAREIVEQTDKQVAKDPRKLEAQIRSVVKLRRDREQAKNTAARKTQADPVKALFKAVEAVESAARSLREVDLTAIKELDAGDKGEATKRLYDVIEVIDAFTNDRLAKLALSRKGVS